MPDLFYQPIAEDVDYENRYCCDLEAHVSHEDLLATAPASAVHTTYYMPMPLRYIRTIIDYANSLGVDYCRFVDLGSGKGKVNLYAAEYGGYKQNIGIEFDPPLFRIAEENRRRRGLPNVEFRLQDAQEYFVGPGDSIIFLFNPFDETILMRFLQNNMQQLVKWDNLIVSAYDEYPQAFYRCGYKRINYVEDIKLSFYRKNPR
jgi:SAM-dependent methyltransferase